MAPAMYWVMRDTMSGVSCTARGGGAGLACGGQMRSRLGGAVFHPWSQDKECKAFYPMQQTCSLGPMAFPTSLGLNPACCLSLRRARHLWSSLRKGLSNKGPFLQCRGPWIPGVFPPQPSTAPSLTCTLGLQFVEQVSPGQVLEEVVVAVVHGAQVPGHGVGTCVPGEPSLHGWAATPQLCGPGSYALHCCANQRSCDEFHFLKLY